ncbi:MAG: hypothetical protein S4CHLAM2_01590 [Chlamydiales bacterium]|nr:hypothetical protein [Chlamydiales bacterium]
MNFEIEIHEQEPPGFKPDVEVSSCFIEIEGKILLLEQGLGEPDTGTWGVPAGKKEPHETLEETAHRELFEETGIRIKSSAQLQRLGCLYIRKPEIDYVFHLFQVKCEKKPSVSLSSEHQSYQWADMQELDHVNLMAGALAAFDYYRKRVIQIDQREFYFVRHGQTDPHTGNVDISLNEIGLKQAHALKGVIAPLPFQTVCFSPLKRAIETKQIVGAHLGKRECQIQDLAECSKQVWDEMIALGPTAYQNGSHAVKGFMNQALRALYQALSQPGPVLIVAHGGTHWAICCLLEIQDHSWLIENCVPIHFTRTSSWEAKRLK